MLIRDPYRYTDATLIVPPGLVQCLQFFDGVHMTAVNTDRVIRYVLKRTGGVPK